jgi:hypothetical protein
MLRPSDITPANVPIALKPLLGKEKKLYISLLPAIEMASATITGAGALTATISNAGAIQLEDRPCELLIKLEEEMRAGAAVVLGVIGTDEADAVISGAARFSNPTYAQEQGYGFPAGTAREVLVAGASRKFKTITTIVPQSVDAEALGGKFSVFGLPDSSSFILVGCRVNLNYTPENRQPLSVACGGDDSAFVKPGQKPVREVSVTVKLPSYSDGLKRYNGMSNLVLLAKSDKEERVVTDHEYLIGAQLQGGHTDPEASEPSTLEATGQYEDYAHIPAGPLTGA